MHINKYTSLVTGTFLDLQFAMIYNQLTYNLRHLCFSYYTNGIPDMYCDQFLANENTFLIAELKSFLGASR